MPLLYKESARGNGPAEEYFAVTKTLAVVIGLSVNLLIGACSTESSSEAEADDRHVWSDQTDTIERARQVEDTVLKAAEEQRRALEAIED